MKKQSRQYLWAKRKIEAGLCGTCGRKRVHYKIACDRCAVLKRKMTRAWVGCKPYSGKFGRKPFVKE